jgi:hypothetical protein
MSKVEYSKSIKKQIIAGVGAFASFILILWSFSPVNTPIKTLMVCISIILVAGMTSWGVKKYAKKANCTSCDSDIFEYISVSQAGSSTINYCPVCGENIEI